MNHPRRGPGRPATLSSERIVDAAMGLVTRTGSLTMAELGADLGVDPSAVYWHFRNRSELVSAIADRFTAPLQAPMAPTDDWRADFEAVLRRVDEVYRSNPPVAILILTEVDLSGATLEVVGSGIDVLRRSGAAERDVFVTMHAVEIALACGILYDLVGAPGDDDVRRAYHRRIGRFDVDDLYPTAEEFAAESASTAWLLVQAVLDRLERSMTRPDR